MDFYQNQINKLICPKFISYPLFGKFVPVFILLKNSIQSTLNVYKLLKLFFLVTYKNISQRNYLCTK